MLRWELAWHRLKWQVNWCFFINKILGFSLEFLVILIDLAFCIVSYPYEKMSLISRQEMSRTKFCEWPEREGDLPFCIDFFLNVLDFIIDGFPSKLMSCPGISQPPIITSPASSRYQVLNLELRCYLQKYHLPCLSEKRKLQKLIYLSISSPNLSPMQSRL